MQARPSAVRSDPLGERVYEVARRLGPARPEYRAQIVLPSWPKSLHIASFPRSYLSFHPYYPGQRADPYSDIRRLSSCSGVFHCVCGFHELSGCSFESAKAGSRARFDAKSEERRRTREHDPRPPDHPVLQPATVQLRPPSVLLRRRNVFGWLCPGPPSLPRRASTAVRGRRRPSRCRIRRRFGSTSVRRQSFCRWHRSASRHRRLSSCMCVRSPCSRRRFPIVVGQPRAR